MSYHEHAEVRQVASHAEHGGLQILLVSRQVNESDDLGGLLTDLGPVQTAAMAVGFVDDATLAVKAQDVIPHAAGATALQFMLVTEKFLTSETSAII